LITSWGLPVFANPASQSIPTTIAGYPVIFIQTPENTCGLAANEVVLTLLDKTPTLEENPVSRQRVSKYLQDNPLPKGWAIEVYGGPNATEVVFGKVHKENYDRNKMDSVTASIPALTTVTRTWSADKNADPSSGNNIVTYQSAWWSAPIVSPGYLNNPSFLMNNVLTNTGYFLQSGQKFDQGGGANVWADTGTGTITQDFNVAYVAQHNFRFAIGYISSNTWFMSCTDLTGQFYDDHYENDASGNKISPSINTSIWFEHVNSSQNWWWAFNPYVISVNWANEVLNGQISPWGQDQVEIKDSSGQQIPNNGKITGGLANYNTAHWHLDLIP
jgi:hypothetical protein